MLCVGFEHLHGQFCKLLVAWPRILMLATILASISGLTAQADESVKLNVVEPNVATLVKIGKAASDAGDQVRAEGLARSALAVATTPQDRLRVAALFTIVGEAKLFAAQYVPALVDLRVALPMFTALDKPAAVAQVASDLGLANEGLQRFDEALTADLQAREIHHALGQRADEALDLHRLGTDYGGLGRTPIALSNERNSLALYIELKDESGKALALASIGALQQRLGNFTGALEADRAALAVPPGTQTPQTEAVLYRQEQVAFEKLGQRSQERDAELKALAIYRTIGDREAQGQMLVALGFLDSNLYRYADAAAELEQAVGLERARNDRVQLARCLESLGGVYGHLYRYEAARRSENEALSIETALQLDDRQATTLNEIGQIDENSGRPADALAAYQKMLVLDRHTGHVLGESDALNNIGNVYEAQGLHRQAAATLENALRAARAAQTLPGQAAVHLDAAIADTALGRRNVALTHYRAALRLFRALHDRAGQATTLADMSAYFLPLGRNRDALAALAQSRALAASISDRRVTATIFANMAAIETKLGEYDAALADNLAALTVTRSIGDRRKEAIVLANIALSQELVGNLDNARTLDTAAFALNHQIGDRRGAASVLGILSTIDRHAGNGAAAISEARQQLSQMRALGDTAGQSAALSSLASAFALENRCPEELRAFAAARAIEQRAGDRQGESVNLASSASANLCLQRWSAARADATVAIHLARDVSNPSTLADALFSQALADIQLGRRAAALAEADGALQTMDQLRLGITSTADRSAFFSNGAHESDFDRYTQMLTSLAITTPNRGYDRKAFAVFERRQVWAALDEFGSAAARRYARVPERVTALDLQLTRQRSAQRTDLAALRLQAAPDQPAIDAADNALRATSRQLAALQMTIRNKYPHYYALEHPAAVQLGVFQRDVLQPGEAVLAYDVLRDFTTLWLIDRTHFKMLRLARSQRIAASVARYVQAIKEDIGATDSSASAAVSSALAARGFDLYRQLVPDAIRPLMQHATQLIVIPSGALAKLPWEALVTRAPHAGTGLPHYLIEDHSVSYVPSATLLALTRATGRDTRHAPKPLLAFADPDFAEPPQPATAIPATAARFAGVTAPSLQPLLAAFGQTGSTGVTFPALPGTRREAEAVRAALDAPAADIHTGADASRATVLKLNASGALKQYRYVLFATHAVIPEDRSAGEPALLLAPSQTAGRLTVSDVLGLTLTADFVALSACRTGDGQHAAGEGISGLTRAFLYAGTPAISVTLWESADQVGPRLSPLFFAAMRAGASPAAALQRAKLALVHGADRTLRKPFYWAPTVIFGDGGTPKTI